MLMSRQKKTVVIKLMLQPLLNVHNTRQQITGSNVNSDKKTNITSEVLQQLIAKLTYRQKIKMS